MHVCRLEPHDFGDRVIDLCRHITALTSLFSASVTIVVFTIPIDILVGIGIDVEILKNSGYAFGIVFYGRSLSLWSKLASLQRLEQGPNAASIAFLLVCAPVADSLPLSDVGKAVNLIVTGVQ